MTECERRYRQGVKGKRAIAIAAKRYRESEKGKLWEANYSKNHQRSDKAKAARRQYQKVWRTKNAVKARAEQILNEAIKAGLVERKPCVECGKLKTDAHHADYSKPLEVEWLCRVHHYRRHYEKDPVTLIFYPKNGS
jgi:hypothetical protein